MGGQGYIPTRSETQSDSTISLPPTKHGREEPYKRLKERLSLMEDEVGFIAR